MSAPIPGIPIPSKIPRWGSLLPWLGGVWVTVGERVANGSGVYQAIVEGLTAPPGSGGPTGTTTYAEPSPGSAIWEYVGPIATTWTTGSVLPQGTQRVGVSVPNTYIVLGQGGGNSTIDPSLTAPVPTGPFATSDGYTWQFMAQALAVDTEPSEGQKDVGWLPGQQPPAQYLNWQIWRIYRTLLWVWDTLISLLSFPFAAGVRRIATVPDITTLAAMFPSAALYQIGIAYAQYAYVSDSAGNLWYASAAKTSGGVTFPSAAYPGATVADTTSGLTWTCAALAGNTPAAPLYDPTVVYALNQVVSDPNGLIWFLTTAAGSAVAAPAWPTTALVAGVGGLTVSGSGNTWTLAGLGRNSFVNTGDVISVQGIPNSSGGGSYRFRRGSAVTADNNVVITSLYTEHLSGDQWWKADATSYFTAIIAGGALTGSRAAITATAPSGTGTAIDAIGAGTGTAINASSTGSGPTIAATASAGGPALHATAVGTQPAILATAVTGAPGLQATAVLVGPGIVATGSASAPAAEFYAEGAGGGALTQSDSAGYSAGLNCFPSSGFRAAINIVPDIQAYTTAFPSSAVVGDIWVDSGGNLFFFLGSGGFTGSTHGTGWWRVTLASS